jgi:dynein heavy chain
LIDAILPPPDANPPQESEDLQKLFLFCLTWSLGGALVQADREKFNAFLISLSGGVLVKDLYANAYDMKNLSLEPWEKKVEEYQVPADKKFSSILVPTTDTTKYSWLMNTLLMNKRPVMFCGDSGTAKTVTVFSCFRGLNPDNYTILNVNFSSRTSSKNF